MNQPIGTVRHRPMKIRPNGQTQAVAGMHRCGTTLMFRTLARLEPGNHTPSDYDGPVLKTHACDPAEITPHCALQKAIFMFGDPVTSVVSSLVRRPRGVARKLAEAGLQDMSNKTIYRVDALGLVAMFNNWTRRQSFALLCLRYETLYDHLAIVRDFFQDDLVFPPYRTRTTDVDALTSPQERAEIEATYAPLITAIARAPDVMVFQPEHTILP